MLGYGSPVIEAAVDNGVVHGGAHGQPHDGQVHLLNEGLFKHLGKKLMQKEVDVVRQPADRERADNHDHHLYHLWTQNRDVCARFFSLVFYT